MTIASALLGGYLSNPAAEFVVPAGIAVTVLANARLINVLARRCVNRRAPAAALSGP